MSSDSEHLPTPRTRRRRRVIEDDEDVEVIEIHSDSDEDISKHEPIINPHLPETRARSPTPAHVSRTFIPSAIKVPTEVVTGPSTSTDPSETKRLKAQRKRQAQKARKQKAKEEGTYVPKKRNHNSTSKDSRRRHNQNLADTVKKCKKACTVVGLEYDDNHPPFVMVLKNDKVSFHRRLTIMLHVLT